MGLVNVKFIFFHMYIKCIMEIEYLLDFGEKKYGMYIGSSGFLISFAYCQIHVCTHNVFKNVSGFIVHSLDF